MGRLQDKVAVITGGASGIGRAIGERFVREGASVVLFDLNQELLDEVGASFGADVCATHAGDVTNEDDIAALVTTAVDRFGRLDIAVNSAGVGGFAPIVDHP